MAIDPTGPVDVHAHAMPMPLLRSLADRGLADVSAVDAGIVKLDPKVSGVGPGAPLPLARSQHDVATRLTEMDQAGVAVHAVSLPPFLFCTNATDATFATGIVAQGNDATLKELHSTIDATPEAKAALDAKGATSGEVVATAMGTDGTLTLITKKKS